MSKLELCAAAAPLGVNDPLPLAYSSEGNSSPRKLFRAWVKSPIFFKIFPSIAYNQLELLAKFQIFRAIRVDFFTTRRVLDLQMTLWPPQPSGGQRSEVLKYFFKSVQNEIVSKPFRSDRRWPHCRNRRPVSTRALLGRTRVVPLSGSVR